MQDPIRGDDEFDDFGNDDSDECDDVLLSDVNDDDKDVDEDFDDVG